MAKESEIAHPFPKNPLEEVRSSSTYFRGKQYVDIRIYYKGDGGDFRPSKKGVTLSVDLLPELEPGVQKPKEALGEQYAAGEFSSGRRSNQSKKENRYL